jgi:hypothetical protein
MPIITTTRYAPASAAMTIAQNLLNDPAGNLYCQVNTATGTVPPGLVNLVPYLNLALGDLRTLLGNNGVQVRNTTQLTLPLNTEGALEGQTNVEISDLSTPQLPTDCIVPLKMWEQPTGSGDLFVPMTGVDQLPNLQPGLNLQFWQWQFDQINLIGATQEVTVQIEYESAIPPIVDPGDLVIVAFSSETLGKGCAYYAAFSDAGETPDTTTMKQLFDSGCDRIVMRYTKPKQFKSRRRKPYGRRHRIVYL